MNLSEYLMSQRDATSQDVYMDRDFPVAKRIQCEDGFSLSVQASHGAYCSPRTNIGPWDEVEVGFPSDVPTQIISYAEQPEKPTETVYGYVPIGLVEALIAEHGGMKANDCGACEKLAAAQREIAAYREPTLEDAMELLEIPWAQRANQLLPVLKQLGFVRKVQP